MERQICLFDLVFFCWLGVSMTYTSKPYDGFMMLVKYGLPLLFLYLGYSALENEKDLVIFLKVVNAAACIYMIFIGGFGQRVFTWFYYTLGFQIFGMYLQFKLSVRCGINSSCHLPHIQYHMHIGKPFF